MTDRRDANQDDGPVKVAGWVPNPRIAYLNLPTGACVVLASALVLALAPAYRATVGRAD